MKTVNIFKKIKVDCLTNNEIINWVEDIFQNHKKQNYILCINPEKINLFNKNKIPLTLLDKSSLRIPDGAGIVWAIKRLKNIETPRITGVDVFNDLLKIANRLKRKIFIYGGKKGILLKSIEIIKIKYPDIIIAGYMHGYASTDESNNLVSKINDLNVDFLFLGLGSPKQEQWVDDNLDNINVGIIQTIGGSLDTIAYPSMRAPKWMQEKGLEWLFRLYKQPFRITRQITLIQFFFKVIFYRNND